MPLISDHDRERAYQNTVARNPWLTEAQVKRRARTRLAFLGIGRIFVIAGQLVGGVAGKAGGVVGAILPKKRP